MIPSLPSLHAQEVAPWIGTYLVHSTLIFTAVWLLQSRAGAKLSEFLWKASLLLPLLTTTAHLTHPSTSFTSPWSIPSQALAEANGPGSIVSLRGPSPTGTNVPGSIALLRGPSATGMNGPVSNVSASEGRDAAGSILLGGLGLLALLRLLVPAVRLRWRLRARVLVGAGPLRLELDRLRAGAGLLRSVGLYSLPELSSPVAAGTWRPAIYLPLKVETMAPSRQRSLLAHELAHIARLDPLWSRIAHAVCALALFQPLHRIARRRLTESAELLADDLALHWTDDSEALASCLAEVAGWVRTGSRIALGVPMVRRRSLGSIQRRVERAFDRPRERGAALRWPALGALATGALLLLPSFRQDAPTDSNDEATHPYIRALTPVANALNELQAELLKLTPDFPGSRELQNRWQTLQQEAKDLGARAHSASRTR